MRTSQSKRILTLLVCLNLCFIWGNSAMTGQKSGDMSGSILRRLAVIFPFFAQEAGHLVLRKLAHFSEFVLLGLLWGARTAASEKAIGPATLGFGLLAACIDETIQCLVPGRASSLIDVWIDAAGFTTGVLVLALALWLLRRRKAANP